MAHENRVIFLYENGNFMGFVSISICNDIKPYEEKDLWEVIPHDPNGNICFVEKVFSSKWNLDIRKNLEKEIVNRFPNVDRAFWRRPSELGERQSKCNRRFYEASIRN